MTDSCPNCCHRGITPTAERRHGDQITHAYQCPACGHTWATARHLPAYSELHAAAERRRTAACAAARRDRSPPHHAPHTNPTTSQPTRRNPT